MLFVLLLGLARAAAPEGPDSPKDSVLEAEEAWRPCPFLRLDEEDASPIGRPLPDLRSPISPLPREPFHWRLSALPGGSAIRALLDPIDSLVGFEHLRSTWEGGRSDVTVTTDVSDWINSLGAPLGGNCVLGPHVDLASFEECDGGRLPLLDFRHGTPRPGMVSAGFSLTIGF